MTITLHYSFEIPGRQIILSDGSDDGYEFDGVIETDYEVELTEDDIIEYLTPYDMKEPKYTKDQIKLYQDGMCKVLEQMSDDLKESLYEEMEYDDYFLDYLHDKYEDEAKEKAEAENE